MSSIPYQSYLNVINTSIDVEEKINTVKYYRGLCLQDSDWTQFNDSPLTEDKKLEWASYRQALRDVPQQPGYPDNIIWPDIPS